MLSTWLCLKYLPICTTPNLRTRPNHYNLNQEFPLSPRQKNRYLLLKINYGKNPRSGRRAAAKPKVRITSSIPITLWFRPPIQLLLPILAQSSLNRSLSLKIERGDQQGPICLMIQEKGIVTASNYLLRLSTICRLDNHHQVYEKSKSHFAATKKLFQHELLMKARRR